MYKRAFAKIAIIGCRIAACRASDSKETELSDSIRCGSICDEQAGSSLKAFRTSHAVSVLPLQASFRSSLFHTEAGDLRGQLLPGPQTGSRASMSLGNATDLSMSPSGSGAFSMSPPTTRQISRDRWRGAAAGPARGLARRRRLPTCLPLLEVGHR